MKNPARKWIIGAALIATIGGGGAYLATRGKGSKEAIERPTKAVRGSIAVSVLATGTVQPENRLEIKPPIAGRVEQVLVDEGARVRKGQILVWMSSSERAALLDAARAKGEAEVKQWEEMYKPTPILAPISGMIIARNVEPGQAFSTTDAILVMSDRLTVKAQVDETDIARIALKQPASIELDAYPGKTISAKVDQIAYEAKTVNNVTTYIVDVLPDEAPATMRSGMTANVTFTIAERDDALLVPVEAIRARAGGPVVKMPGAGAGDAPIEKPVETGLSDGKKIEIVSGLSEGDVVLVPEFRLKDPKSGGANPFMPSRPSGKKSKAPSGG